MGQRQQVTYWLRASAFMQTTMLVPEAAKLNRGSGGTTVTSTAPTVTIDSLSSSQVALITRASIACMPTSTVTSVALG